LYQALDCAFWDKKRNMGFKENLKGELTYQNMLMKELAARSGINLHTINNYSNATK
jgi:hypothetical protein